MQRQVPHVAERESISFRVLGQRAGDISRRVNASNQEEDDEYRQCGASGNEAKRLRSPPYPIPTHCHCRTQQQRQRRVAGHRIIFLCRGKRKEDEEKTSPAKRQQTRPSRTVERFEGKLADGREINTPGKQPYKVKKPEVKPRNCIVIAR